MKQLADVTLLRTLAVISLVIWHCYCPYMGWMVGGGFNDFYVRVLTNIIPDANMPLFTFLAGYLFYYLLEEKRKYQVFKDFAIGKINRLFIPFLVLGSLMNLTMYGRNLGEILYGQPNHMWYCLMLFYVYIIFWIIHKKCHPIINGVLAVVSFSVVAYHGLGVLNHKMIGGFFLPIYYYWYFYTGFMIFKFKNKLFEFRIAALIFFSLIFIVTIITGNTHTIGIKSISYIMVLVILANSITNKSVINYSSGLWHSIEKISRYSFGIYVFHLYIIWNITRVPVIVDYLKPWMVNHFILFPIALFIVVLSVSYWLTGLSLKTKIGRYFLL